MLGRKDGLKEEIRGRFLRKVETLGEEEGGALLRFLILHTLDSGWKDHLLAMDELRRESPQGHRPEGSPSGVPV